MEALVTGATGEFGRAVCAELAARGLSVHGVARRPPAEPVPGVTYQRGDVTDRERIADLVDGADVVVHLAWLMEGTRDPSHSHRINVGGTHNVLDAMRAAGTQRLVFASSVMAYGSDPAHPQAYREDEPLRPHPAFEYGVHKREVEALIHEAGVEATIVRAAAELGPETRNRVSDVFAAPTLVGVRGEPQHWQLIHQADLRRFFGDVVVDGRPGTVNLAAADVLELGEVAELLGKRTARLPRGALKAMAHGGWALRLSDVPPSGLEALPPPTVDTTRLHETWGFTPRFSTRATFLDALPALSSYAKIGRFTRERRRAPGIAS